MKPARDEQIIEQIRQNILDAALDIIISDGFDSLTMRRLASGMNMTAPNLYNYFSGKDEIYISIVIRGFKMLKCDIENVCHEHSDPYKRVRAIADTYIRFGMTHTLYYDIMFVSKTPKYHDYINTPHEKLSEIEYHISMEILDLVLKATSDLMTGVTPEMARNRMIQVWSMLHGMVSLHNSKIMAYVTGDPEKIYSDILDDVLDEFLKQ